MDALEELLNAVEENDLWKNDLFLKRNEVLCEQGCVNTDLYFVVSGSLRIFLWNEEKEHTIRFGYRNTFFCALDSYISETPSLFTIQALKETVVKVVSKGDFLDLVNSNQEYRIHYQSILTTLIQQQMEREVDLLTTSPELRYARVLARSPRVFQEIPHKYIASYLRMTPETLSRIKKS